MKPAFNEIPLPKYIAIEGPIGVGKTTLANKIAKTFNYDTFLEQPSENPFLKNFYRNQGQSALATQLFFLFQRMQQIQDLKQRSLFENVRVADFLIEKDKSLKPYLEKLIQEKEQQSKIIYDDVLKVNLSEISPDKKSIIIGNLPYNISTTFFFSLPNFSILFLKSIFSFKYMFGILKIKFEFGFSIYNDKKTFK